MGFSLILRAFFGFPNECQFIECQFFWKFRVISVFTVYTKLDTVSIILSLCCHEKGECGQIPGLPLTLDKPLINVLIDSYSSDYVKTITDKKYGDGASDYIVKAFRYYSENNTPSKK